jgi:glycosyltransferase involved in cell wall biosynthesis
MWALTQATAVTAVSQELARKIHTLASTCRPLVIANGVDTTLFSPAQSCFEAKLAQDQAAVIGFVGEARLKKGLAVLLPAFAHVAQQLSREGRSSPTLLLIGGVRKDDADIVRVFQAQQPTLTVKIIPYTNQAELPLWYQRLDVLVLPSLRDGLPNALLEGMACGCAVVASHVGGIPDVLRSGENGLLVPPGQVEPLARAIIQLLASPQQRQVFGQAARQTVLDNFSPALELTANLKLYRQLLTEPTTLGTLTISGPGLTAK